MSAHTGRVFLNSCLKVPIDPCNNCPAPIYNRPKMYLGRLSATPFSDKLTVVPISTTATSFKTTETETTTLWTSNEIRSLAKFYDSIPDYNDINHLPTDEFYSTLDTLRTTCRELKTKSCNSYAQLEVESCKTPSSHASNGSLERGGNCKKAPRKKSISVKMKIRKKVGQHKTEDKCPTSTIHKSHCHTEKAGCVADSELCKNIIDRKKQKSFREELEGEVESFQNSLKDFEKQLKRPVSSSILSRTKRTSVCKHMGDGISSIEKASRVHSNKEPIGCTSKAPNRDSLKKSRSFNDINAISDLSIKEGVINSHFEKLTNAEALLYKDPAKLSNYFKPSMEKFEMNERETSELPKILMESPSSELTSSMESKQKKSKNRKSPNQVEVPFTLFDMTHKKQERIEHRSPSPMHPVARPNLAATLRVAVSKKKIRDLEDSSTVNDATPQMDWEVRKTPAWKSLSLNEPHKDILSLRLATRKAEQALQQRQYELHMEMMRQRVKSAPLLLEGTTFWGPDVGKHTCALSHSCNKTTSRRNSKMNVLRKIYGNSAKTYSRSSHRSANSVRIEKKRGKPNTLRPDSVDDDLSSLDRAFL